MSNENERPWYKRPAIMVAIIGAVGAIIAAYIGIMPLIVDDHATVTVQGIVTDSDGKPVVGAGVEIDGSSVTTGSDGGYVIPGVPINTKTIAVRAPGDEVVKRALRISKGDDIITYDISLPPPTPTPKPTPIITPTLTPTPTPTPTPMSAWDTNNDGIADAWDTDYDGVADTWDLNIDGYADTWDTNNDGYADAWDLNIDGYADTWDTNNDGYADAWDLNIDGYADAWDTDYDGVADTWL
jgi:hypothetical protein